MSMKYRFEGEAVGRDGYRANFVMDDSLRSWWAIVRWNLHYRHWRPFAGNARDLFTKVIWRNLWRRR